MMKTLVMHRKITLSILIMIVLVCSFQGVNRVAEAVTVPEDPALSDLFAASGNKFQALLDRATRLCEGLEFPRDTFAVNEAHTVLVGHTSDGSGIVIQGNFRSQAGGSINLGWLTLVPRGAVRVLTRYAPSGTSITCVLDESPQVVDPDAPPIYWTDVGTGKIQRANLDGSNVQDLVTGLAFPDGIALDVAGGKMYWIDNRTAKIQRANLDGSNVEDLVTRTQGLVVPRSIALDVEGGKMYWTDNGPAKIQRASLDGSNVEDLVTQGLRSPLRIALDVEGGKMYWTDSGTDKIQRANLDGSNIEDLVTQGLEYPLGIALDVEGGKMYWTDSGTDKIQRANLDGSNIEDLVTQGLEYPLGIALDVEGGKMYWTDWDTAKIQRANLDGSNVEDLVTQGLKWPAGIALSITSQTVPPPVQKPDLVVEQPTVRKSTLAPGERFTLSATVKNQGAGRAAATTLRYYRSTDSTISTKDTEVGTDSVSALGANQSGAESITLAAPSSPGTYYYGACVEAVTGESSSDNNCSAAVSVTVRQTVASGSIVRITGTVSNADGTPVVGATVEAPGFGSAPVEMTTDENGSYDIPYVSFANIAIQVGDEIAVKVTDPAGNVIDRTHTVTAADSNAGEATFNITLVSTTLLSYTSTILAGISLFHVPLDVEGLDTVGDLKTMLGGAASLLIVYDYATRSWNSRSDDVAITADLGIVLSMAAAKTVTFEGESWDDGVSTISVQAGLNLIGLPVDAPNVTNVSDIAGLFDDGVVSNIIMLTADGFGLVSDTSDAAVMGDAAYLVTAIAAGTAPLLGDGWTYSDMAGAAPIALAGFSVESQTPVLDVHGAVVDEMTELPKEGFRVKVKNLSTKALLSSLTPVDLAADGYNMTFVDLKAGHAARVGDILEISADSPNPRIGVKPVHHIVTIDDVKTSRVQLEPLIAYEIPSDTELLPNYPNPFNPETWIPYHLANDTDVSLSIYDMDGALVRELDLGYQRAGYYTDRSRAAYWDGRNAVGESVASGVYFYQLRAGDYSQLRKMVILK